MSVHMLNCTKKLALAIGCQPIVMENGRPMRLAPARPTFLVQASDTHEFMYWDVIPDSEEANQ